MKLAVDFQNPPGDRQVMERLIIDRINRRKREARRREQ
jgi:hypothetical protein